MAMTANQPLTMFNQIRTFCLHDWLKKHFVKAIFFFTRKMSIWFLDFRIWTEIFLCYEIKKWVFHQFGFHDSKISKNRACSFPFSIYRIWTPPKHAFSGEKQFRLYNPNCISTNFESVCNMNNQIRDYINLPNSHPSVLGNC